VKAVFFLVGTTASGKKQVAEQLAEGLQAELLSLESMKVYQGLDRGTDKAASGRFGLTNLVPADEWFSVGAYVRRAVAACQQALDSGRTPWFVGGTGLYLRALVRGLFELPEVPAPVRERVRREVRELGPAAAHAQLQQQDPDAARLIHPNDFQRLSRALEVIAATGCPLSTWQRRATVRPLPQPAVLVGISWPAEQLRQRIRQRIDRMFAAGLIDEVQDLEAHGKLGRLAQEAIGYRETLALLRGESDESECRQAIENATWRFSRRQINWFKQFPEIRWVAANGRTGDQLAEAVRQEYQSALAELSGPASSER
jgi:tRNA dimethylallyltransferase